MECSRSRVKATDSWALAFDGDRAGVAAALELFAARYLGGSEEAIAAPIRYSMLGEGKRLRAILLSAAYRATGGSREVHALAAAVEVVHAYSLVHDDLPCMDDDDMRRGRPTVHRAFGAARATAAGLAMVPLAARAAADAARALHLDEATVGRIVARLMEASGAGGMIGGQLLDLEGEGRDLTVGDLERVHRLKTGALITASIVIGAIAAGATPAALEAFERYGAAVGLAFQIADDLHDVTASTDVLGKTAGRDAALRKSTYPGLLGLDGARRRATTLSEDACLALDEAGIESEELRHLARYVVARPS